MVILPELLFIIQIMKSGLSAVDVLEAARYGEQQLRGIIVCRTARATSILSEFPGFESGWNMIVGFLLIAVLLESVCRLK